MATVLKKLAHGTLTDGSTTLYTAPAATQAIVKSIFLCNKTAGAITVTLTFDAINVLNEHSIDANDSLVLQMTHVIEATEIIAGLASANASVDFYISGVEVS